MRNSSRCTVTRTISCRCRLRRADRARRLDAALGDRSRERDYRAFFTAEVGRLGIGDAIAAYLPTLIPGIAASATHAFMRLAYGVMRDDPAEVGAALGYWSAIYLSLCSPSGAAPVTDDPGEVLLRLQPVEAFRHVEAETGPALALHARDGGKAGIQPVIDWLRDRSRHLAAGRRGFARALCRHRWISARCTR